MPVAMQPSNGAVNRRPGPDESRARTKAANVVETAAPSEKRLPANVTSLKQPTVMRARLPLRSFRAAAGIRSKLASISAPRTTTVTPFAAPRWTTTGPCRRVAFLAFGGGGTAGGGEFLYFPQPRRAGHWTQSGS